MFILLLLGLMGYMVPASAGNDVIAHPHEHSSCNKALCASIVSYCMIQEKCGCNPQINCSCCTECAVCLGDSYRHCCDCVGMRKGSNYTAMVAPTVLSTVGLLDEPESALYHSLTVNPMPTLRCSILRFPVIEELTAHRPNSERGHHRNRDPTSEHLWNDVQMALQRNHDVTSGYSRALCTATYFDQCMPLKECSWSCERMGATSFRWFHNGCCECAGPTCINYGNRYPKCAECLQ